MGSHRSERIWFQLSRMVGPLFWAAQFRSFGIMLVRIMTGTFTQCCLLTESEDKGNGSMQAQNPQDCGSNPTPALIQGSGPLFIGVTDEPRNYAGCRISFRQEATSAELPLQDSPSLKLGWKLQHVRQKEREGRLVR